MASLAIIGRQPVRRRPLPQWPVWDQEEVEALRVVVESGCWRAQQGTEVRRFEAEFAAYQEATYGVAVTNGTVALKLALTAAGVGVGDEVIIPGYTFVATATAAVEIGAVPVFADIDPGTYTLDPTSVAACITPRTRAIVPVHIEPYRYSALSYLLPTHDRHLTPLCGRALYRSHCSSALPTTSSCQAKWIRRGRELAVPAFTLSCVMW